MNKLLQTLRERQDLLIGLVFGAAIGWIVSTAPGWAQASNHEDWWEIGTAVGTVGAAAVALGLGLRDGFRRRRDGLTKAKVIGTTLEAKLVLAHLTFKKLAEEWEEIDETVFDVEYCAKMRKKMDMVLSNIAVADVQDLAYAPGDCAMLIASGLSQVGYFHALFSQDPTRTLVLDAFAAAAKEGSASFLAAADLCANARAWR
jgi:hypothetical protein